MYNQIKLLLISVFTLLVSQKIKPYVDGKVTDALTQAANTAQDKADAAQQAAETFATTADAANLLLAKTYTDSKVAAAADDIETTFSIELTAPLTTNANLPSASYTISDFNSDFESYLPSGQSLNDVEVGEKILVFFRTDTVSNLLAASEPIYKVNAFLTDDNGVEITRIPFAGSIVFEKTQNGLQYVRTNTSTYIDDLIALRTLSQTQIAQVITDLGDLQTAHDSLNTNFSNFLLQHQEFLADYAAKQQEQDDAIAAVNLRFDDYLTAAQVQSLISESQTEILVEVGTILGV
jgi:hypothetical protein